MQCFELSVIIPLYNCISEHTRTLESLRAQTPYKSRFEVVVADKHNTEDIMLWQRLDIIADDPSKRTAALGKLP